VQPPDSTTVRHNASSDGPATQSIWAAETDKEGGHLKLSEFRM
jgi:hypothetical protein